MPSNKYNSIKAMAMHLIFALFDITAAQHMPFIANVCFMNCALLLVPFIFADSTRCQLAVMPCDGFPTGLESSIVTGLIVCRGPSPSVLHM